MAQLNVETGLYNYVNTDIFGFKDAVFTDIVNFEFEFKGNEDEIDYIENHCSCTKAWYERESGKIVGTLKIANAGVKPGKNAINKAVTIHLDPEVKSIIGGPKKEKTVNPDKRTIRLTLAGTAFGNGV